MPPTATNTPTNTPPPTATNTPVPTNTPGGTPTITPTPTVSHAAGTCDLDGATETHDDADDGRPCEAGFWKGHMAFTDTFLPIKLGIAGSDCDVATKSTKCLPPRIIIVDRDAEAHNILSGCGSGDSSVKMTCELLAAKLNLKSGSVAYPYDPTCILPVIQQADALLSQYGYNTKPTGAVQTTEKDVANKLHYWNKHGFCL